MLSFFHLSVFTFSSISTLVLTQFNVYIRGNECERGI